MVSVAFITYNNNILLFLRDNIPQIKDPDCWDVIGGHDEPGETPEQTLKREIEEEISIKPQNIQFLFDLDDTWGEKTYVYSIKLTGEEAAAIKLGNEGQKLEFFELQNVKDLKLTQNLKKYYAEKYNLLEKLIHET